ncbi:hypothetical protein CCMA1212_007405 [Trichoderma ghanense]|uniref:Uncharacterized protein n=1 Tax=Trichoderma ghanense TaxID=65468 RepID=A0ABY2GY35_9HYPO
MPIHPAARSPSQPNPCAGTLPVLSSSFFFLPNLPPPPRFTDTLLSRQPPVPFRHSLFLFSLLSSSSSSPLSHTWTQIQKRNGSHKIKVRRTCIACFARACFFPCRARTSFAHASARQGGRTAPHHFPSVRGQVRETALW